MIRHVVLMTFKDEATPADLDQIEQVVAEYASKVDYAIAMEHGRNINFDTSSPKASYAIVVDFASMEDCHRYNADPEHAAVGKVVQPWLASVLVTDFEIESSG